MEESSREELGRTAVDTEHKGKYYNHFAHPAHRKVNFLILYQFLT